MLRQDPVWSQPNSKGQYVRRRANSATGPVRPVLQRANSSPEPEDVGRRRVSAVIEAQVVPPRPPRNPARPESTLKKKRSRSVRPSTSTGVESPTSRPWEQPPRRTSPESPVVPPPSTKSRFVAIAPSSAAREEVTPWEFEQGPSESGAGQPSRLPGTDSKWDSDVTPWEFDPGPKEDTVEHRPVQVKASSPAGNARPASVRQGSVASSSNINFNDLPLVRRRRSVESRPPPRSRSTLLPARQHRVVSGGSGIEHTHSSASHLNEHLPSRQSIPTLPSPGPPSRLPNPNSTSPNGSPKPTVPPPNKFSTADRTILQELRRNMDAIRDQFAYKGGGPDPRSPSGVKSPKKHHPYPIQEVPYPRHYERDVLDLDVWETMFCKQLCGSLTWHVFETPPIRVLDLGCGTGIWILNCARMWKESRFVGLDVVPLHPDLQQAGSPDLASRITWVQHNFLEGLPFPNDEFDFVHIKRIALGVPEDKWDCLMEEITRVMKPGAAFEMIEEDLFFPGKSADSESESDTETSIDDPPEFESEASHERGAASEIIAPLARQFSTEFSNPSVSTNSTSIAFPPTPRSTSPVPIQAIVIAEDEEHEGTLRMKPPIHDQAASLPFHKPQSPAMHQGPSRFGSRSTLPSNSNPFGSPRTGPMTKFGGSTQSLLGSSQYTNGSPPILGLGATEVRGRPRGSSSTSTLAVGDFMNMSEGPSTTRSPPLVNPSPPAPVLLRTTPKPPVNPRDHSLLETIYTEMHSTRFVNLAPLALLANTLGLYFKGLKTHPPLNLTFPPAKSTNPPNKKSNQNVSDDEFDSSSDPDDDAKDAILPTPVSPKRKDSRRSSFVDSSPLHDEERFVTRKDLFNRTTPFASLDDAHPIVLTPTKSTFSQPSKQPSLKSLPPLDTAARSQKLLVERPNILPNQNINLDLQTLNLHLHVRTSEIVACAETMWEWVQEYQAQARNVKRASLQVRADASSGAKNGRRPPDFDQRILELGREDFDGIISRFSMDMQDQIGLNLALEDRFSWSVFPSEPSLERSEFDAACERWAQWEAEQHRRSLHPGGAGVNRHRVSNSITSVTSNNETSASDAHSTEPLTALTASKAGAGLKRSESRKSGKSDGLSPAQGRKSRSRSISVASSSGHREPTTLMSRSLRVFVAWKAK